MRILIYFLLLTGITTGCNNQPGNEDSEDWLNFEYDEAKAYYFDNHGDIELDNEVVVNGKLNSTIFNPEGATLTNDQIEYLWEIMDGKFDPDEVVVAACFLPRNGIVFYQSDEIVASISICFERNQFSSSPSSSAMDTEAFQRIFQELNLPTRKKDFPSRNP